MPDIVSDSRATNLGKIEGAAQDDPLEYEEPEDYVLRLQLGLRPIVHAADTDHGGHPDQRPCPSWCYINGTDYGHTFEWDRPLEAVHTMRANPSVAASLYPASSDRGVERRLVCMSKIEPRLEQRGQDAPVINVAMRIREGREMRYTDELLRLSLDDAQDLITALSFLVKTAEKG